MKDPSTEIAFRGLADIVSERLRAEIMSGELQDGQRVVERDVALRLGVSRGPVRDALQVLESEGLVTSAPRRGTRVASMKRADAAEVWAIREALEPVAVRSMLEQHNPAHLEQLAAILDAMDRAAAAVDWAKAVELDMQFHATIYELCGLRRVLRVWESLRVPLLQFFRVHRPQYVAIDQIPARHRDLFESLASGDVDRAMRHSAEHVVGFRESVLQQLLEREG